MKIKNIVPFCYFLSIFLFAHIADAQENIMETKPRFAVDAEFRTRANILYGYMQLPTSADNPAYVIGQRTRLNMSFKNKIMEAGLSFQDARFWGDGNIFNKAGVYGDTANIELYEGWAALKIGQYAKLKIGRQQITLDDERFLSKRNWLHNGLTYDAAVFNYGKNGFDLSVALSYNNNSFQLFAAEYNPGKMKSLNYIYLKKEINNNLSISFSNIYSGYQSASSPTVLQFKTTVGPFIKFNNKKLFAKAEFYYQLGKTIDGTNVSAYFFNTELGYNINKFYLGAGIDYLSGQNPDETEKYQVFDLLYGARFKYYGNLNYFVIPGHTNNGGLVDPFAKLSFKFNEKNKLNLTYHLFQTAQNVTDLTTPGSYYDKKLGSELDIIYTYKVARYINIKVGYHIAFPSETLEIFKGITAGESETPQWLWLMFTFKPVLF